MASRRGARLQTRLLDALIRTTEARPVRALAHRTCRNRPPAPRGEVVEAVTRAVEEYYREHRVEAELAARQARVYQRVWFRQRVREFRQRAEAEETVSRRNHWRRLARYFRRADATLGRCQDSGEVIAHLARYYADDMAADLNPAFFIAFKQVAKRLFPRFVASIRAAETAPGVFDRLRELDGAAPLIYLPNHVSNADHIPICFALNSLGLRQPKIAAGANLFRGASTLILPRVNCYKIRREQIGAADSWFDSIRWFQNPIYRRAHAEYLRYGWDHDEALLFYVEGTRSRDGTIGRPKLGILGEAAEYAAESGRALHAVPVSISYTVVPEDRDIEASRRGENISHRDLVAQLTALDRSYKAYGEVPIHVALGMPVPIAGDGADPAALGAELLDQVKAAVVPSDTSVAAACLLAAAEPGDAARRCHRDAVVAHWAEHYPAADAAGELADRAARALHVLALRGFLEEGEDGRTLTLVDEPLLAQYANRIAHLKADG